MVSVLISGLNSLGLRPGRGHCVVFLGKTLLSQCLSASRSLNQATDNFNAGGNSAMD